MVIHITDKTKLFNEQVLVEKYIYIYPNEWINFNSFNGTNRKILIKYP